MRNSKIGVLSPVCKIPKQDCSGLDVIPTFWSPASMSPYQKGTAPYRGVSSYLLQLWVCQKGLGNWEHRFSPFIPSPFSWALSSTVSLRLKLSSFLHSTNMPEHLLRQGSSIAIYTTIRFVFTNFSAWHFLLLRSLCKCYFSWFFFARVLACSCTIGINYM